MKYAMTALLLLAGCWDAYAQEVCGRYVNRGDAFQMDMSVVEQVDPVAEQLIEMGLNQEVTCRALLWPAVIVQSWNSGYSSHGGTPVIPQAEIEARNRYVATYIATLNDERVLRALSDVIAIMKASREFQLPHQMELLGGRQKRQGQPATVFAKYGAPLRSKKGHGMVEASLVSLAPNLGPWNTYVFLKSVAEIKRKTGVSIYNAIGAAGYIAYQANPETTPLGGENKGGEEP